MTRFLDGPAAGKTLSLSYSPYYLRVVIDPNGAVDALDAPDDMPRAGEVVHLYRRQGNVTSGFIDGRDPKTGKRFGRRFSSADYTHFTDHNFTQDQIRLKSFTSTLPKPPE